MMKDSSSYPPPYGSTECAVNKKQEDDIQVGASEVDFSKSLGEESCGTLDTMELLLGSLELVRSEAARKQNLRKPLMREKFRQCRQELVRSEENQRDPLTVLPEEIWKMTLDYLDDDDDVASCAKTCTLFCRILNGENASWELQFGKVFPFLFNQLTKKEVLKCRSVSKRWYSAVDSCLQNYYTIDDKFGGDVANLDRDPEKIKRFHFEYSFEYSFQVPLWLNDRTQLHRMSRHSKNPFIGGSVTVFSEPHYPEFYLEFPRLIHKLGEFIWHFSMFSRYEYEYISPQAFYSLSINILLKCKNLRGLYINGTICGKSIDTNINGRPFPNHRFLETVSIEISPFFSEYQDKLLRKYCAQLKRVDVELWNSKLYHNFQWTNLRELRVGREPSYKLLSNLVHLNAPNLREMNIRLDGKKPKFGKLMRMINHFPNLDHLELRMGRTFCGVSDEEIINLPPELACCTSVKTLEITMCKLDISYNFVICFPHARKLILRDGASFEDQHQLHDYDDLDSVDEESVVEIPEPDVENQELQNGEDGIDNVADEMYEEFEDDSDMDFEFEDGSDMDFEFDEESDMDFEFDNESDMDINGEVERNVDADVDDRSGMDEDVEERSNMEVNAEDEGDVGHDNEDVSDVNMDAADERDVDNQDEDKKHVDADAKDPSDVDNNSDDENDVDDNAKDESDMDKNTEDESGVNNNSDDEYDVDENAEDIRDIDNNAEDPSGVNNNAEDENDVDDNAEDENDVDDNAKDESDMDKNAEDESDVDNKAEEENLVNSRDERSDADKNVAEENVANKNIEERRYLDEKSDIELALRKEDTNAKSNGIDSQLGANSLPKSNDSDSKPKLRNELVRIPLSNIQHKWHVQKVISEVHTSNVWEVLPKLETVVFYMDWSERKVYSRKGYEMREMDQIEMLNLHWKLAKKDAAHRRKLKCLTLLDLHEHQMKLIEQKTVAENDRNLVVTDLFEKVFQLISSKLSRKEILSCRGVCKIWCSGVDSFLENYVPVQTKPGMEIGKHFSNANSGLDFAYKFRFPCTPEASSSSRHDSLWEDMKSHDRNPFIGRTVELQLSPNNGNVESLKNFLEHAGNFIWHVKLSCSKIKKSVYVSCGEYYVACYAILKLCPNIRSLYLTPVKYREDQLCRSRWNGLLAELKNNYQSPPYFESLIMLEGNCKPDEVLQNKLLDKYYSQLKRVQYYYETWNKFQVQCQRQWNSLEELTVLANVASDSWLEYMMDFQAPQLTKLCILLNGQNIATLKTLVQVVHNFKKLQHFEIRFANEFAGVQSKKILSMPPGFTSTETLKSMKIVIAHSSNFSFDFLIYFPYLRKLSIRTEALDSQQDFETCEKPTESTLINLSQYMQQEENSDVDGLVRSNIWEILPILQTLTVTLVSCGGEETEKVYCRQVNP